MKRRQGTNGNEKTEDYRRQFKDGREQQTAMKRRKITDGNLKTADYRRQFKDGRNGEKQ